jgi:hypothetical protein
MCRGAGCRGPKIGERAAVRGRRVCAGPGTCAAEPQVLQDSSGSGRSRWRSRNSSGGWAQPFICFVFVEQGTESGGGRKPPGPTGLGVIVSAAGRQVPCRRGRSGSAGARLAIGELAIGREVPSRAVPGSEPRWLWDRSCWWRPHSMSTSSGGWGPVAPGGCRRVRSSPEWCHAVLGHGPKQQWSSSRAPAREWV